MEAPTGHRLLMSQIAQLSPISYLLEKFPKCLTEHQCFKKACFIFEKPFALKFLNYHIHFWLIFYAFVAEGKESNTLWSCNIFLVNFKNKNQYKKTLPLSYCYKMLSVLAHCCEWRYRASTDPGSPSRSWLCSLCGSGASQHSAVFRDGGEEGP
jgi:hypothetical protein